MQQTIEINGNIGDEVCLKYGDATLIVKLGEGEIVPDFVSAFVSSVGPSPYALLSALNNQFHGTRGAIEKLRETVAIYRDQRFSKIQPKEEEKIEEAPAEKTLAKKKTSSKKKDQD